MGILTAKEKAEMAERAAENRKNRIEAVREGIKIQQLVKVLEDHALGKGRAKMTPAKLKAIEILLGKAMPDLAVDKNAQQAQQVVLNITTNYSAPQPPTVEVAGG